MDDGLWANRIFEVHKHEMAEMAVLEAHALHSQPHVVHHPFTRTMSLHAPAIKWGGYVLVIPLILGHEWGYGTYTLRGVSISPRGEAEDHAPTRAPKSEG